LSSPARTCGDDLQEPKRADDGRLAAADRFRYEDTGPRVRQRRRAKARRALQFMRLRDRGAPRANSATSNWRKFPGLILRAIDFRVPVKQEGAGGADCCTEAGSGLGSNVLKFPVNQYERLFTTYGRFNMSHLGT
jgi:hypothetical protein